MTCLFRVFVFAHKTISLRVVITANFIHNLRNWIHSVYQGCLTYTHSYLHNNTCRHHVPVLPYPGITMHNSCSKVLSADKSQRLHLLFIENSSHLNPLTNRVSSKHSSYFFSSRCLCFGKDLSGLISRDEGVRRGEEWQEEETGRWWERGLREEMRPKDKVIIVAKVELMTGLCIAG